MSGMADVLGEHYINYAGGLWKCTSLHCAVQSVRFDEAIEHQAAALSAAGFGPVQEARAEAWDEGCSFGSLYDHTFRSDNPYREDT